MAATSAQALLTAPGDGFDAKAWINLALTEASEGAAADEPADMRLSVLLTRLLMPLLDLCLVARPAPALLLPLPPRVLGHDPSCEGGV